MARTPKTEFNDPQSGPPRLLAQSGAGKVIVCDAGIFAGRPSDVLMDVLEMAALQGYRVAVTSDQPLRDRVLMEKWRDAHSRLNVFMEGREVVWAGDSSVAGPYLRITHAGDRQVNSWAPHDPRLALSLKFWHQGARPMAMAAGQAEHFRARSDDITKDIRRESLRAGSALAVELARNGIDLAEFRRSLDERMDIQRGLVPPKPKGPQ